MQEDQRSPLEKAGKFSALLLKMAFLLPFLAVMLWILYASLSALFGALTGNGTPRSESPTVSRVAASTPAKTSPSSSADYLKDDPASSEAKAFLLQHWNSLLRTCPGLVDYASDLKWEGINDMSEPFYGLDISGVGIQLRVSDRPKVIPKRFIAQGHTCEFRVLMDGKRLVVPKPTCASVCLETEVASNGADHIFALKQ